MASEAASTPTTVEFCARTHVDMEGRPIEPGAETLILKDPSKWVVRIQSCIAKSAEDALLLSDCSLSRQGAARHWLDTTELQGIFKVPGSIRLSCKAPDPRMRAGRGSAPHKANRRADLPHTRCECRECGSASAGCEGTPIGRRARPIREGIGLTWNASAGDATPHQWAAKER